jgi:hypothetical protein
MWRLRCESNFREEFSAREGAMKVEPLAWARRARATLVGTAALAALGCVPGEPAAAADVPFLAHLAVYDLTLTKSRRSPAIDAARGRILYNFAGSACEGYTTDLRHVVQLGIGEGRVTLSDQRATSFEDGEGKTYRFRMETRKDNEVTSIVDGTAERREGGVTVSLTKPQAKTVTLPSGTVFPTEQMRRIIAAAREGKSLLELDIYDGSDTGEKAYHTLTVIGRPIAADQAPAQADAGTGDASLARLTRWPVTVSYYETSEGAQRVEGTPVYAMTFELYENGVTRALSLDYNDFVLGGAMTKYEVRSGRPCKDG